VSSERDMDSDTNNVSLNSVMYIYRFNSALPFSMVANTIAVKMLAVIEFGA